MEITQNEFILYAALGGAVIGLILGLIPLLLGIKKSRSKLGIIGFICSLAVGPIAGVLSLIVSGIFVWLILKKNDPKSSETSENTNVS